MQVTTVGLDLAKSVLLRTRLSASHRHRPSLCDRPCRLHRTGIVGRTRPILLITIICTQAGASSSMALSGFTETHPAVSP